MSFNYREDRLHAEDVPLSLIAETHETPCYVYSRTCIEANYAAYRDAFGAHLKRLVPQTLETSIHFNGTTEPQPLYAILDSKNGCHYYNL